MTHETIGRESILKTSATLFGEKGYTGVSIRDIAQACGLTNAALYYYFKNKDDLFLAVIQQNHQKTMESLAEAAQAKGDLRLRLRHMVMAYVEAMRDQRQSFQTLRRDLKHVDDARAHKLVGGMRSNFLRPIEALIEAAQANGELAKENPHLLARLLHGMIIALTYESRFDRQARPAPEEVDTLVEVFLKGVGR